MKGDMRLNENPTPQEPQVKIKIVPVIFNKPCLDSDILRLCNMLAT